MLESVIAKDTPSLQIFMAGVIAKDTPSRQYARAGWTLSLFFQWHQQQHQGKQSWMYDQKKRKINTEYEYFHPNNNLRTRYTNLKSPIGKKAMA